MEYKKEIIKAIESMSGRYAPYNIFSDWVEMCALSIQNAVSMIHNRIWRQREELYMDLAKRYTEKELETFAQMFVWLGDVLTESMSDVLGEIYMETDMGSKYTGQFFTPFHVSELCARMGVDIGNLPEIGRIRLHEPSCGGGGMVIAVAQDLDWKGVYMTYLQLSLIGCRAIVVQGDTLASPYTEKTQADRIMRTPAMMGVLI